ncbi:MAG TPA: ABC transporter permease, partial [Mycobacterium sp.]|nr:ABC transporter permease [Mycobacterium sp.]
LPSFAAEATWQVWLGPAAPADAVQRLTSHGLIVQGQHTTAQRADALAREGPALALRLLLACAVAAVLLAVAATVIAVLGSSRRRAFELAALRMVGVRRAALIRASFLEQLTLLGTALVLGVPAGWVAARLVMPAIPEYSRATPLPSSYLPAVTPVVILFAALAAVLAAAALAAALALIRAAVPNRLREAGT